MNLKNILKEFYKRFVIPFYIPILTLIPLILIVYSKESENFQKTKMKTFFTGMITIIFSETTIRMVSENLPQNIVLIILPVIFISILYLYFLYKFKFFKYTVS